MLTPKAPLPPYQFGDFTFDRARRLLSNADGPVDLRPKSFDVLALLLARAGEVVTKDEFLTAIWADVTVSEESLTRCISDIRHALGDEGQTYIKTIPRRGYQLAVPVSTIAPSDPEESARGALSTRDSIGRLLKTRLDPRHPISLLAAALVFVALIVLAQPLLRRSSNAIPSQRPAIAVLPFSNLDGDARSDYFADGLAHDLTTRLSRLPHLVVIARDSAFAYKGSAMDPKQIGRALAVRYLLRGSVRREATQVRISVQLIDAATGLERWAQTYDREMPALFAIQDELGQKIATSLISGITKSELDRVYRKPPGALDSYDAYLRGIAALADVDSSTGGSYGERLIEARSFLEKAVAADARYAPALTALSDSYHRAWLVPTKQSQTAGEFQSDVTHERSFQLAKEAVAADPLYAEAHAQLAWVLHWRKQREEALKVFRQALDLDPNMADGRWALLLIHNGRADEGIAFMQRVATLDPFHRSIYFSYLANGQYLLKRFEESLHTARLATSRMPEVLQTHVWRAAAAAQFGELAEARASAQKVVALDPKFATSVFVQRIQFSRAEDAVLLADGLRKAGLPN